MYVKSPIFYMGNKFDLLEDLLPRFPLQQEVDTFIDLFGGSGTVSLNVPYKNIIYNELNTNIVSLLKVFKQYSSHEIISHIQNRIKQFDLNVEGTDVRQNQEGIEKIRQEYNSKYVDFRSYYNNSKEKNILDLYTLTFYSFCNLIRFNSKNEFNMPFGNRCFTKDHSLMIQKAINKFNEKEIQFKNENAFDLLANIKTNNNTFIYLDPPYSNTMAIYNESRAFGGWSIEEDYKLFEELDRLDKIGVKWAMSNVLENKGKKNEHLEKWAKGKGYMIIHFEDKEYVSLGKGNSQTKEVLIVNYNPPYQEYNIFDYI